MIFRRFGLGGGLGILDLLLLVGGQNRGDFFVHLFVQRFQLSFDGIDFGFVFFLDFIDFFALLLGDEIGVIFRQAALGANLIGDPAGPVGRPRPKPKAFPPSASTRRGKVQFRKPIAKTCMQHHTIS